MEINREENTVVRRGALKACWLPTSLGLEVELPSALLWVRFCLGLQNEVRTQAYCCALESILIAGTWGLSNEKVTLIVVT